MEYLKDKIKELFYDCADFVYTNWTTTKKQRKYLSQQKNEGNLPNKCEICGLRAGYTSSDENTDEAIMKAGKLKQCGLTINFPRNINGSMGGSKIIDKTYFCAVSNLRYWNKPTKKCPDWQLKIDPHLNFNDYLSIYQSKINRRTSILLSTMAAILTLVIILLKIFT